MYSWKTISVLPHARNANLFSLSFFLFPWALSVFRNVICASVLKFMRTDKTGLSLVWDSEAASLELKPKVLPAAFSRIRSEVGTTELCPPTLKQITFPWWNQNHDGTPRTYPNLIKVTGFCYTVQQEVRTKSDRTVNASCELLALKKKKTDPEGVFIRGANDASRPQNSVDTFAEKTMFNISLTAGWAHIMMERAHDGNRRTRNWPAREKWTV